MKFIIPYSREREAFTLPDVFRDRDEFILTVASTIFEIATTVKTSARDIPNFCFLSFHE